MPTNSKTTSANSKASLPRVSVDPAAQEQFEAELYWCIKQLQLATASGKLNDKQLKDNTKALNALMSDKSPAVKKRQIMRISFGDYRAKMAEEERKMTKSLSNIKIAAATPNKQSVFMKKSSWPGKTENDFKFGFAVDKDQQNEECTAEDISENRESEMFHFVTSNNSFQFNFEINESSS